MSEIITSQNLDEVIKKNIEVKAEIQGLVNDLIVRFNTQGIKGEEKLAFKILKDNYLIQLPIDDKYWGGAVVIRNDKKIPIINTAQPRVYQYFVAWHEVYHLLYDINLENDKHNISIDMELNERKADYFAASIMLGNVYEYYHSLSDENFIDRIIKCMDMYKAPYKVIMINLYEDAVSRYNNNELKNIILKYFDSKPSNLIEKFEELELDSELVKPSYVISMGGLEKTIQNKANENPSVSYHNSNYEFLNKLKNEINEIKRGLI